MTSKCSGPTGGCVQCLVNSDCKGTNSVCSASKSCQCHPKSSTNLLNGGNFDTSALTGWMTGGTVQFGSDDDADGCNPASGYISLGTDGSNQIWQCANGVVAGNPYYFGIKYKEADTNTVFCSLVFYSMAGCGGTMLPGDSIVGATALNTWTRFSKMITAPTGAVSAKFTCNQWGATAGQLDQAYLNTSDNY